MFELIDKRPPIEVQEREYARLLGFPPSYELSDRSKELADWARRWYRENGRPWVSIRQAKELELAENHIIINGEVLSAPKFRRQLSEAKTDHVMLVAASAGKELEAYAQQLWHEGKPDEYFFLEIYGSAVVEHLVAHAAYRLCEWADHQRKSVLPHYSPGYPGWNIADQKKLFRAILHGNHSQLPRELSVRDTGMLDPKKSLLAVFGITSRLDVAQRLTELIPCERCSLASCQFRRVPYRSALPQIEGVRTLQRENLASPDHNPPRGTQEGYSFSIEALKKWSRERLRLSRNDDKTVEGRFRYDGTTCSNMGRPLEFEYVVRLSSKEDGYQILDARCAPASHDVGYTYMCEYREDGEALMRRISDESPLLGRRLHDVFDWKRTPSPSGCYCDRNSRDHKWGLVLEVLHYALTNGFSND